MFVTLPFEPHESMADLTSQASAYRALNQICSIMVGRRHARATDSLKDDPSSRIQKCLELTLEEATEVSKRQATDPAADKQLSQAHRKIDSLQSLALLARIIQQEVIWDDQ